MAHGRTRNVPPCMATGQAAGIAASIALDANTTVRNVSIVQLQAALHAIGMPLHSKHLS
ncbi:MAG TPA: FAD-dependent oxidoreductase [Methylovirgula sp.]|nr:FAD-dependent oxidoreductase [Methylovirgula sp.]